MTHTPTTRSYLPYFHIEKIKFQHLNFWGIHPNRSSLFGGTCPRVSQLGLNCWTEDAPSSAVFKLSLVSLCCQRGREAVWGSFGNSPKKEVEKFRWPMRGRIFP
jgi:hypothetical protein